MLKQLLRSPWRFIILLSFFLIAFVIGVSRFVEPTVAEDLDIRSGGQAWEKHENGPEFVPNEVVVGFREGIPSGAIEQIIRGQNGVVLNIARRSGLYRIKVPDNAEVENTVQNFRRLPEVAHASRNTFAYAFSGPNDTYYNLQWHLDNTRWGGITWQAVWERSDQPKGAGASVAVIDTGVAWDNPNATDLAGQNFLILSGSDVFNNDNNPTDDHGHGTHVTGTIAQATNNARGTAGVASQATIVPIKVLDQTGSGTEVEVVEGIYLALGATAPCNFDPATPPPAKIINMSLGWPIGTTLDQLPGLADALECALTRDVVTVAAAGNEASPTQISYPAAYPTVIAVGATTMDEKYTWYSNANNDIDLVAPGGEDCSGNMRIFCLLLGINPDKNGDGYADAVLQQTFSLSSDPNNPSNWAYYFLEGTSMATPHVSGVAALVRGVNPQLTALETRSILEQTADDLGNIGWPYGHGLVNASAAVAAAAPTPSPTPTPTPMPTPTLTPTPTPTPIPTPTPTPTPIPTPTPTPIPSPTPTPTPTPPANQAPTAVNNAYSTVKNKTLNVAAPGVLGNDTDPDGNPLTAILVSKTSRGTLNLKSDGSFTYAPKFGFVGTDKFTYKANDGLLDSNVATVTITVRRK